jgi:hypothetical protein
MNFRTTIVLLVVLVIAGAALFISRNRNDADKNVATKTDESAGPGKKLLDLTPANVNKLVLTPESGQRLVFERAGAADWRMVEPLKAPADTFKVDDLVREVTDLRTTGRTDASGKGLDKPKYVIELTDKDGKVTKVNVGSRSAVGDILYVRAGDAGSSGDADIVSASIIEQLDKPATEYRKNRLLAVTNDKVSSVTITQEGGKTLKLARTGPAGADWEITEPQKMPGDSGQVSSLLSSITNLDAVKFVSEDVKDPAQYGLNEPQMTIAFSTAPPATQPSTQPATTNPADTTTIKFGRASDIKKKNVYAIASPTGPVVTVAATTLDAFKKTPLDLRDRKVLDVDANAVSRLSITTDKAATTQPTTQPASKKTVALERRSEVPTASQPATSPATTKASSQPTSNPSAPQTKWLVTSDPKGNADDSKVTALVEALHPLRAEKFLETFPTTQAAPAATFTLKVSTRSWGDEAATEHDLKITDPGHEAKLVGQLGGLSFELDRSILDKLTADFAAPKPETVGPTFPSLPTTPTGPLPPGHPPIR